jgi:putative Mn2+ efflux pump MntP
MLHRRFISRVKAILRRGLDLIASFLQQATAQGTRSTILNPLGWFFGICVAGLLGSVRYNAAFWIQLLIGCFAALSGLVYLGAYVFCLATKREHLLRTEKFLIQQLAIEKGFRGDSTTGVVMTLDTQATRLIENTVDQPRKESE